MQSVRFVYVFQVWISGQTEKIVNIYLLSLQKYKNTLHPHFATIPLYPTILSGFKSSDLTFSHSTSRIKFVPTPPPDASWDRLIRSGGILQFYRRQQAAKQQDRRPDGGMAKTISCLTISKNHIATSPTHPPKNPTSHHTSIRNTPIFSPHLLSRQTDHFEKSKKSRQ